MRRCSRGGYPPRHKTTAPAGSAGCFERECSCFAPVRGLGCGGTPKNNDIAILLTALQWVEPAIASQGQRLRKIPARNRSAPRPDDLCFARSPLSECPQRRCAEAGKSG